MTKAGHHLCLFFLLCLTCLSFFSYAGQIRFVTEIMSPFQLRQGQQLTGFAIELVREIRQKAGLDGKIEVYPWARAYNIALHEPNVFIFTLVKTPERLTRFKWIGEYYVATDSFYALRSRKDIKIRSMNDAKKYVICIPRNDVGEQHLMELGFDPQKLRKVASQAQCLGMLYRNRVDLNLFNEQGILTLARKFDVDATLFQRVHVVSKAVMGIAASLPTDDKLVKKVRQALNEIKRSAHHQLRIEKWFNDSAGSLK